MKSAMTRTAVALAVLVGALGLAACGGGSSSTTGSNTGSETSETSGGGGETASNKGPIKIGAAIDETNLMKFFDGPALAAAEIEAEKINKEGGVDGRKIEFTVENTQLEPAKTKSVAENEVNGGAEIMWVTCDVDWATPSIQVGLKAGLLTVSPCIGTDQMGPKRFGSEGELAFSYGNVAQDEGAALAALFKKHGWKTVDIVPDQSIAFTQNVCESFKNRFEENGGKVVVEEKFTEGDGTIGSVANHVNSSPADAILICATTQNDLPTFVSGVRSAGNQTPIVGPWSIDGSFWLPKSPKISNNIWVTTYASIYGDDPNPEVRELISEMDKKGAEPATGGFVTGASAIDGIKAAVEENEGSTEGKALAESMVNFKDLPTISGEISFSPELHTVFGREYRVIEIKDGKPHYVEMVKAGTPAEL
ncbi:MAG: ABC transporter substrate-binding protein [Actinobacteria bacterium]|nr:ABC transporter substrate-binding protein [Actinomycetota bacterium]